ncbi:hypothetical protein PMAYCL1PPCAC_05308, partial [Pristionchus mayeri]
AVCIRIEQYPAQPKNLISPKLSDLGLFKSPLAPDDVTSETHFQIWRREKMDFKNLFLKFMKNEVDRPHWTATPYLKVCFRRDVVWSQRRLWGQNECAHRFQYLK